MTDVDRAVALVIENWEALGVAEHDGVLHLPAAIKRRNAKGGVDEQPVMLRNVTNDHKFRCRKTARAYALKMDLNLDKDHDMVREIENYAILAFAIRDSKKPFDQHVPDVETLIATYDAQSLADLWARYNVWVDMLDPRFGDMNEEQLWQAIARIHAEKNPGFLASFDGVGQITIITFMAAQCMNSPTRPSWLQS